MRIWKKLVFVLCFLLYGAPAVAQTRIPGVLFFETTAAMTAITNVADETLCYCANYATEGDKGGGFFKYDADSAATVDGGVVFNGPGGTGRFLRVLQNDIVNVYFYGDSVSETDWDDEIQAAADYCAANNQILYFPAGTLNVNASMELASDVDASPEAIVNCTDRSAIVADGGYIFKVGNGAGVAGATLLFERRIRMPRVIQGDTVDEWASGALTTEIGVWLEGTRRCEVHMSEISNFGVGLLVEPDSDYGNDSNQFYIGHIDNCAIGIRIQPGDNSGWSNENYYYLRRISISTAEGTNISGTRLIDIQQQVDTRAQPNGNKFYNGNLEGGAGETPAEFEIRCEGSHNVFTNMRFEGTNPKVHYEGLGASDLAQDNLLQNCSHVDDLAITETTNVRGNSVSSIDTTSQYWLGAPNTDGVLILKNATSESSPALTVMPSASNILDSATDPSTEYLWRLDGDQFLGKNSVDSGPTIRIESDTGDVLIYTAGGDANPRLRLDASDGRLDIGEGGASATDRWIGDIGSIFGASGTNWTFYGGTQVIIDASDLTPVAMLDVGGSSALTNADGTDDLAVADDAVIKGVTYFGDDEAPTQTIPDGGIHVDGLAEFNSPIYAEGRIFEQASNAYNNETLAATKTLVITDAKYQRLDPGGAGRTVTLPAEATSDGLVFIISNWADGAENLTVQDDGTTTIAILNQSEWATFVCNGTSWIHMGILPITSIGTD